MLKAGWLLKKSANRPRKRRARTKSSSRPVEVSFSSKSSSMRILPLLLSPSISCWQSVPVTNKKKKREKPLKIKRQFLKGECIEFRFTNLDALCGFAVSFYAVLAGGLSCERHHGTLGIAYRDEPTSRTWPPCNLYRASGRMRNDY